MTDRGLARLRRASRERKLRWSSERTLKRAAQSAAPLTSEQRWTLGRWQSPDDRQYVKVQQVAEERDGGREAREIYDVLVELIDTAPPIGDTVYAWRGIRSCRNTFGVDDLSRPWPPRARTLGRGAGVRL